MFKSAILASVVSLTAQAAFLDLDVSAGSHKKYRPGPSGPSLVIVD